MDFALTPAENASGIHPRQLEVSFVAGRTTVHATLNVPVGAQGVVVLFASARGTRFDRGARFVAEVLEQAGLGTLALDPLDPCTENEVIGVIAWLRQQSFTAALSVGLLSRPDSARAVAGAGALLGLPHALLAQNEPTEKAAELAAELFSRRLVRP